MSRTVSRVLRKKKVSSIPTAIQNRINPSTFRIGTLEKALIIIIYAFFFREFAVFLKNRFTF